MKYMYMLRKASLIFGLALLTVNLPVRAVDGETWGSAARAFGISFVAGFYCNNQLHHMDHTTKNMLGLGIAGSGNIAVGQLAQQKRDWIGQISIGVFGYLVGAVLGYSTKSKAHSKSWF